MGSEPTELNGRIVLTDKQLKVETEDETATFHFLLGMLSSEITTDGFISRSVTLTYGETTINGRFLRTGRIQSADGGTYFDLDTGEIGGNIKFKATSDNTSVINSIIRQQHGQERRDHGQLGSVFRFLRRVYRHRR